MQNVIAKMTSANKNLIHDGNKLMTKKTKGVLILVILSISFYMIWWYSFGRDHKDKMPQVVLDVRSLQAAIINYRFEYGTTGIFGKSNDVQQVSEILLKTLIADNEGEPINSNPKKIRFLELLAGQGKKGRFLDPWSHPYNLVIGINTNISKYAVKDGVAVWSSGTNGINENGFGDDICGWNPKYKW
jgi:hypothetical protein